MLEYLEDVYNGFDRGSYRFSKEQRDSFRLVVDMEILSTIKLGYRNYKYPLPQEFFGYCQLFYGTSHFLDIPIRYPRQRIIDSINWQTLTAQLDRRRYLWHNALNQVMADATLEIEGTFPDIPSSLEVFSLPETVIKFQSEFDSAFRFIVSWLPLDLLEEFGEQQDSDDSDPSDDRDEYPQPEMRDESTPIPDNFEISPSDLESDPRDFGSGLGDLVRTSTILISYAQILADCFVDTGRVWEFVWEGAGAGPYTIEGKTPYDGCPGLQGEKYQDWIIRDSEGGSIEWSRSGNQMFASIQSYVSTFE